MDKQSAEMTVKIMAVAFWAGALGNVISGLIFLFFGTLLATFLEPFGGSMGSTIVIILGGIIILPMAGLNIFAGLGLWKYKPWAKTVAIVMAVIDAIFFFPLGLIVGALIVYYLAFNPEVKALLEK